VVELGFTVGVGVGAVVGHCPRKQSVRIPQSRRTAQLLQSKGRRRNRRKRLDGASLGSGGILMDRVRRLPTSVVGHSHHARACGA